MARTPNKHINLTNHVADRRREPKGSERGLQVTCPTLGARTPSEMTRPETWS
jgi:hypothetical protein